MQSEPEIPKNLIDVQDEDINKYIKEFEKLENEECLEKLNDGFYLED